jgi:hypothetical protein
MGINNVEIICKFADECRTLEALRDYVIIQIKIYKTILKLIDKEFDYANFESANGHSRYHAFINAVRRLG